MAALNSWQKITRVIPGKPFGNGTDGSLTISGNTTQDSTRRSCSGTSGTNTLTLGSSGFSNGDVILIHHSRGTTGNTGGWEVNRVSSGGGTSTLTLQENLQNTYTDSGADQSQVIKIPMYQNVTVNESITWSAPEWDGDIGGIFTFAANGTTTYTGTNSGSGTGFRGGVGGVNQHDNGTQGEGSAGAGSLGTNAANGNGGGAGTDVHDNFEGGGGGGGGYAVSGSNGVDNGGSEKGLAGNSVGNADLTTVLFGGAGGGGSASHQSNTNGGNGGDSGSFMAIFAKTITITGSFPNNGNNGSDAASDGHGGGGGGGAGGSTLIVCQTATLGSNLITATAGSGGNAFSGVTLPVGGAGAVGRIAVHHSSTVTGTTNPTFTDTTDGTLIESDAAFLFNIL